MLLTRLGDGSKIVVTGDTRQTDKRNAENGLLNLLELLQSHGETKYIQGMEFVSRDIQRHPAVKEVLHIFKEL